MVHHHAGQTTHDHLDAAQDVDATARTVDVAHPNGDALDRTRILPKFFAESSTDVCPVSLIEPDSVDSDICRCQRRSRATRRPLDGPGHSIRERFSLSSVSCPDAFA
jgi:hypothetical protein